jgi:hypothetical protein
LMDLPVYVIWFFSLEVNGVPEFLCIPFTALEAFV